MPQPQPVSPAHRTQLRWGLVLLFAQLALQSFGLWLRLGSGFEDALSNAPVLVLLAAGWGLFAGGLAHVLWRGPLSRLQTFLLYLAPTLALSLPTFAWLGGQAQAQQFSNDDLGFSALSNFGYSVPAREHFFCYELLETGLREQLDLPEWAQLERDADSRGQCFGAAQSGPLTLEQLAGWIEQAGGRNVTLGQPEQRGNMVGLSAYAELPSGSRGLGGPYYARVRLSAWGIRHVNRTAPLTEAEQRLMRGGISSFVVGFPAPANTWPTAEETKGQP